MKLNRFSITIVAVVVVVAATIPTASTRAAAPGSNISRIMKAAHTGRNSLANRAKAGKASAREIDALARMYRSLYNQKPPKGSAASWKQKTVAILRASETMKRKPTDPKARAAYSKALNCTACHRAHR